MIWLAKTSEQAGSWLARSVEAVAIAIAPDRADRPEIAGFRPSFTIRLPWRNRLNYCFHLVISASYEITEVTPEMHPLRCARLWVRAHAPERVRTRIYYIIYFL